MAKKPQKWGSRPDHIFFDFFKKRSKIRRTVSDSLPRGWSKLHRKIHFLNSPGGGPENGPPRTPEMVFLPPKLLV